MIDPFLYTPLPIILKKSIDLAYLGNGTYDQIVAHLEKEIELSGMENNGELPIPTMAVAVTRDNENET